MPPDFAPIAGAQGWQVSNPPVLSTAPLLASLDLFRRTGIARLREKSIALTGYMRDLIEERLAHAVEVVTPANEAEHGCQLSLKLTRPGLTAKRCNDRLLACAVVADTREPDILRLAPVPLYNSFCDVHAAIEALVRAVES